MGWLIKGILFFVVISWIIKMVMRLFLGGVVRNAQEKGSQQQQRQASQQSRTGNIHVNQPPDKNSRKNKTSDDFRGGDYIDYEEVD